MNYLNKHAYSFINYKKFHMLSYGEDIGNRWYETVLRFRDYDEKSLALTTICLSDYN